MEQSLTLIHLKRSDLFLNLKLIITNILALYRFFKTIKHTLIYVQRTEPVLYIAYQNGDDNTVRLFLSNEADNNFRAKNWDSSFYIALSKRTWYYFTQLLLSNGADIYLCMKDEASHFYIDCRKRTKYQCTTFTNSEVYIMDKRQITSLCISYSCCFFSFGFFFFFWRGHNFGLFWRCLRRLIKIKITKLSTSI